MENPSHFKRYRSKLLVKLQPHLESKSEQWHFFMPKLFLPPCKKPFHSPMNK